jgi:hypothetical protein
MKLLQKRWYAIAGKRGKGNNVTDGNQDTEKRNNRYNNV